ncbi:MAG: hypothetical protein RLZZ399_2987, partial [Verrucomicrobiota bacterium]
LQQQIDRMIASDRFQAFLSGFLPQWLGMDRLDFFDFPTDKHRHFDDSMKVAARQEVYETFAHTLRSRGSFATLLRSNQVVVNGLLAKYYGIPGVSGDAFRPVALPNGAPRGGLLGMAAIHAMGSNGTESSPVHRGVWIVKTLLNDPPPPAPPNVKQISRLEDKLLTTRERLVAHQEEPQCASCHRRFDNLGFGLENFDAAGLWRTKDSYTKRGVGKKEWDIDAASPNSRVGAFANFFEMRDRIAGQDKAFVAGFTRALLGYALGRSSGFSDDELVEAIVQRSQERGFVIRDVFQLVGGSAVFQTK